MQCLQGCSSAESRAATPKAHGKTQGVVLPRASFHGADLAWPWCGWRWRSRGWYGGEGRDTKRRVTYAMRPSGPSSSSRSQRRSIIAQRASLQPLGKSSRGGEIRTEGTKLIRIEVHVGILLLHDFLGILFLLAFVHQRQFIHIKIGILGILPVFQGNQGLREDRLFPVGGGMLFLFRQGGWFRTTVHFRFMFFNFFQLHEVWGYPMVFHFVV